MTKYKILITGGAGFIGSKLSTKLVLENHYVTVIDNLKYTDSSLNHIFSFSNFKFIKGDVRNKNLLKTLVKKNDIIIPLAGLVGAPLCEKNKKYATEVNLNNIKFILSIIKNNQKIIYPTTNSGYGIGEANKFCDENTPLNPISHYGVTKSKAENEVLKYKNSVCFRLATVFGYSYRMRTDLLVNNFVYLAIKEKKLELFESHFRRNFIHIDDVVNAFNFAIKNFSKLKGHTYNLGLSSANINKLTLAKKIKKQVKKLKIIIRENRKDPDKRDYFVSNKKIEKKGFKAKVTLEAGIKELVEIFKYSKINILNNY
jgi:nucleoside-diphosphate-sugar epimerase